MENLKRPYAFMLVAVSLDGKIAPRRRPGQPNPVGPALIDPAIMQLHNQQRASADAIMVGLNCILLDDSRLTLREGSGRNPVRIVLDGLAEMPLTAKVLGPEASTDCCGHPGCPCGTGGGLPGAGREDCHCRPGPIRGPSAAHGGALHGIRDPAIACGRGGHGSPVDDPSRVVRRAAPDPLSLCDRRGLLHYAGAEGGFLAWKRGPEIPAGKGGSSWGLPVYRLPAG